MFNFGKMLAVPIVAASLLAGCATSSNGVPPIDPAVITNIQNTVTRICGYVPAAITVANIIATFAGGTNIVALTSQIANGICGAVTSKSARYGGKLPTYRGVVIRPAV